MPFSKRQAQLLDSKTITRSLPLKTQRSTSESLKIDNTRKRKTSLNRLSIEPIKEEPEEESATPVKLKKTLKKQKLTKTFQEDSSWD